jgi:hypothetical protein
MDGTPRTLHPVGAPRARGVDMAELKTGTKVLLNTTTRRLEAEVLEVHHRTVVVYVPATGQTLEVPKSIVIV